MIFPPFSPPAEHPSHSAGSGHAHLRLFFSPLQESLSRRAMPKKRLLSALHVRGPSQREKKKR